MNPEDIRRFYAEEIRVVANLRSAELVNAFAKVPRENFLGDGPWTYATPDILTGGINYRETESLDSIAKELGGHADGFGAFGNAKGE